MSLQISCLSFLLNKTDSDVFISRWLEKTQAANNALEWAVLPQLQQGSLELQVCWQGGL